MGGTIFIINPNSSETITAGIDEAVNPLRILGGPKIACVTVPGGPAGIQTQRDVESVIGPMLAASMLSLFIFKSCFLGVMLFAQRMLSNLVHTLVVLMVAAVP